MRIFRESKASSMHFFAFSTLQICVWKQTFSPGKDERYRLTFDWRFSTLSQSEVRVHWWTHNSKNPTNLGRRELNSTLHQSSNGFATRVHGFATKTKALAREIPPSTQATSIFSFTVCLDYSAALSLLEVSPQKLEKKSPIKLWHQSTKIPFWGCDNHYVFSSGEFHWRLCTEFCPGFETMNESVNARIAGCKLMASARIIFFFL